MKMEMKHLIIGILILIGIAFVGSEYGIFQELSVASSPDSPELVYQIHSESYGSCWIDCPTCAWTYHLGQCKAATCVPMASGNNIIWWNENPACTYDVKVVGAKYPGDIIEYCYFGAEDPNPYDNIDEAKCIGYCNPGKTVCVGSVLQTCTADGSEILKTYCEHGCENNACISPDVLFGFNIQTADSYLYGQDALVQASIIVNDMPYSSNLVNGKIIKDGGVISEASAYTDENGVANLLFRNVEGVGDATIQATTLYLGEIKTVTKDIYFGGETIIFIPTTYSYFQYTTKDVEFNVEIKDAKGRYITPTTGELTVISTMTNANILSSNAEYIGNGVYRVTSDVSGSGLYNGKVNLLYQGVNFESLGINIDVRDVTLEIDTSGITPMATLGDTETIRFTTTSSIGGEVDPDNITIEVSYPAGYITETFTMDDLTRVSTGVYEFDFTFTEVEKFTFNIFADKEDYTRGTARASVSVAPVVEEAFNPLVFLLTNISWIIGAILLIIGIIVYRRLKK